MITKMNDFKDEYGMFLFENRYKILNIVKYNKSIVIFDIEDTILNYKLALKFIPVYNKKNINSNSDSIGFFREAAINCSLSNKHPSILNVHQFGQTINNL